MFLIDIIAPKIYASKHYFLFLCCRLGQILPAFNLTVQLGSSYSIIENMQADLNNMTYLPTALQKLKR